MYQGKHTNNAAHRSSAPRRKRRLRWRKEFVLFCSVVVLLLGVIGGTVAYLVTNTDPVENTFTPATSGIDIPEVFDKETKKDVTVKNKSDYAVYARATYVAYWVSDADGSVIPGEPVLTKEQIGSEWGSQNADGYWYYNQIVPAGATTAPFIVEMTADKIEGRHLVVDVIAETVQAEPEQAVEDVWGFVPTVSNN